jgi:hypothetical protein
MDINALFTSFLTNPEALKNLGTQVGVSSDKVHELAKLGVPAILKSIHQNTSTQQGADSLFQALKAHEEDKGDNLTDILDQADATDGKKILQHVFSSSNDTIQQNLATKTGLDISQVSGILSKLAPVVMGVLGQQKKQQNLDASGLSGLLGIVTGFLDTHQDGNMTSDLGNLLGGLFK